MAISTVEQFEEAYLCSTLDLYWLKGRYADQDLREAMEIILKQDPSSTLTEVMEAAEQSTIGFLDRDEKMTFQALYSLVVQRDKVVARADNLLVEPDVSASWHPKYQHEAAKYIIQYGTPVRLNDSIYNWQGDLPKDVRIIGAFNLIEDRWTEFGGTMGYGDTTHSGMSVEVFLSDGYFYRLRLEADLAAFMRAIS